MITCEGLKAWAVEGQQALADHHLLSGERAWAQDRPSPASHAFPCVCPPPWGLHACVLICVQGCRGSCALL